MKSVRVRDLVLALVAALSVVNTQASSVRELYHSRANGSGSSAIDTIIAHSNSGRQNREKLFGGRHNDRIPSLGAYRRSVGLLLQASNEESEQLQGCISVAIAPRFFLTRASCVRDLETPPLLFIEAMENNGSVTRHPLSIKTTTVHPDYGVNLAIVEADDKDNALKARIKPMELQVYTAKYYNRDDSLSLVSIDNIFNPSLASNAQSISSLIRVPVRSCQYNSEPSTIHCFSPAELANRQMTFEFGQGMLLYKNNSLVGLPDCERLCSGGMFYSATYLGTYKKWIDNITVHTTRWMGNAQSRVNPVPTEDEPTYVSLYTANGANPVCAGSLIAPRFVLTTASCATKNTPSLARMNHGERTNVLDGHEDTIPVAKVTKHPQFGNTTKFSNDVAILELSGPTIYLPTLLASDDSLDQESSDAVVCHKPRRSSVDSSIMCLPPVLETKEERQLGEKLDTILFSPKDFSLLGDKETVPPSRTCPSSTIEQWNKDTGDGVFDVPDSGSYYLIGLSTGLHDTTVAIKGSTNGTEGRICSLNDTVGDDDNAALVVRLATTETVEFIDSISDDHTWRNPQKSPFRASTMMEKSDISASVIESQNVAYEGALQFDQPPKNLDLGFVVGLRFEKFGQNYCGGSLIAPSYVLTAAHCVGGDRAKYVSVGSHESKGAETELITVKSTNIITHPLYGKRSMYSYDVAILELDSQAYPKPIILDNSRQLDPSMYLTLFGYGADSASSTVLSEVLRSVDLPYFPRDKCKTKFPELDDSMFCAGGELARDACTGDSGSPLVRIVNGKPRLVGVVSSGRNGCGTPGIPGVYAFVAEMQNFIDSVVAGNKWVDSSKRLSSTFTTSGLGGRAGSGPGSETRAAESDGTVLRSYDVNQTDLPFDVINMANGAVQHQLSIVEMATDTPRGLLAGLLEFLIGDFQYIAGWRPQIDEYWKVAYYSSGDLTPLMKLIGTHRSKPLYNRKNRFERPTWVGVEGETRNVSSDLACANGH